MKRWVKLHTKILTEPKVLRLPDRLFRTCINLIALAGYLDDNGQLGAIEDVASHLRLSTNKTADALTKLGSVGITVEHENVWFLKNWDEYNGSSPSDDKEKVLERVHKHREKTAKTEERNAVTEALQGERNDTRIEKRREEEIEIRADAPKAVLEGLSEAAKEYFSIFKRKRWANSEQQAEFEKAEGEVGAAVMLRAVKWAGGNNIVKVPAICTTARKMAKGGPSLAPSAAGKNGDNGMKGWN